LNPNGTRSTSGKPACINKTKQLFKSPSSEPLLTQQPSPEFTSTAPHLKIPPILLLHY
jgi:hypothetical protein